MQPAIIVCALCGTGLSYVNAVLSTDRYRVCPTVPRSDFFLTCVVTDWYISYFKGKIKSAGSNKGGGNRCCSSIF